MGEPDSYSYLRYLQAKETVDERARNERVWHHFLQRLSDRSTPVRILEVGAGEGATAQRILSALTEAPVETVQYTLVDVAHDHLAGARKRLRDWAADRAYSVSEDRDGLSLTGPTAVTIHFEVADLFDYAPPEEAVDAVVAQAVLDLLPLSDALSHLRAHLRPDGLLYLPIHFDGVTAFEPQLSASLDSAIEDLYHESMTAGGEEGVAGASTGRRLLTYFQQLHSTLVAAGASDWVVFAGENGYVGDEAYFLHHVVRFIEEELSGHPELEAERFDEWVRERRRQITRGELIFVAHQLDVLSKEGGGP